MHLAALFSAELLAPTFAVEGRSKRMIAIRKLDSSYGGTTEVGVEAELLKQKWNDDRGQDLIICTDARFHCCSGQATENLMRDGDP